MFALQAPLSNEVRPCHCCQQLYERHVASAWCYLRHGPEFARQRRTRGACRWIGIIGISAEVPLVVCGVSSRPRKSSASRVCLPQDPSNVSTKRGRPAISHAGVLWVGAGHLPRRATLSIETPQPFRRCLRIWRNPDFRRPDLGTFPPPSDQLPGPFSRYSMPLRSTGTR